jgi:uncharacterized phiE125 gp8 family phage protein
VKNSVVTTAPSLEPLDLAYVKTFLKLESSFTDDDTFITNIIKSARQWCEERTNRSFISQVRSQYQDCFYSMYRNSSAYYNGCIELLYGPLIAVDDLYVNYIKYYDENDTLQTLSSSEYWVDTTSRIPRIWVKTSWPTTKSRPNAVEISYNAGFDTDGSTLPGHYKTAMELYIAHFYENRVPELSGVSISKFEMGIERLLDMGTVYQNAF